MKFWNHIFKNKTHPKWLVRLNNISLSGIFLWPFVLFISIFLFDHPTNLKATYGYFFLINSYPIALLLLTWLSFKVYPTSKILAATFPIIPIIVYAIAVIGVIILG